MIAAENDSTKQNDSSTEQNESRGPGNYTQTDFATLVECPKCGVETRVTTPSVGLATCDEDECGIRAFVLDETEEDKYGT